jgi:peptide deformylase
MALLKVARMGHPVLVRKAEPLTKARLAKPATQTLIDDMIETMFEERGVGLAAPQVYESLRLFVMNPVGAEERKETIVIVNPELVFPEEETMELWEGCLSIPGIRGKTQRWSVVDVAYLDRKGNRQKRRFEGFPAAIVQHETDHLDGIFFFERMPDLKAIAFEDEYVRHHRESDDEDEEGDEDEEVSGTQRSNAGRSSADRK